MCLAFSGCQEETGFRKPTIPVTGKVTVDGIVPDPPVQITCVNNNGMDSEHPTLSRSETDPQTGEFRFSTYVQGDGVPEGDYALTFTWQPFNLMSRSYGADKFKGKYAKANKSEIKVTIKAGDEEADLGTIDLKSKSPVAR